MTVSVTTTLMAIGLTVSQLVTAPAQKFIRHFDPKDTARVAKILHDGCAIFDVDPDDPKKKLGLPDMIDLATESTSPDKPAVPPAAGAAPAPVLKGIAAKIAQIDWPAIKVITHQICDTGVIPNDSPARLPEVIAYFNEVFEQVEDISFLKNYRPPTSNSVLDGREGGFTMMSKPNQNRVYVRLADLPKYVPQAFVSAEDKMYYRHGGIDTTGILRAAMNLLGGTGRTVGGSTIAQQMIKNVTKKAEPTFARKMREMYLASLASEILTKDQMLEIYFNEIPLGRGTVGLGMAAKVYFNKSATELTLGEAAELAGINQGPDLINPDKRPALVEKKRQYVLTRMLEDVNDPLVRRYSDGIRQRARRKTNPSAALAAQINDAKTKIPTVVARPRKTAAYYFVDEINRQVQRLKANIPELKDFDQGGFVVHSTINPQIQAAVTLSTQDGLANFERRQGRVHFKSAVGTLKPRMDALQKTWQELLPDARLEQYYDVLWPLAVILPMGDGKTCKSGVRPIGLKSGRVRCLNPERHNVSILKDYDLVFIRADDADKQMVRLSVPPEVQGATIVLENLTGRVLGMSGGFSYGASQLNRATQTKRQPGSTMKPLTYLYAMGQGYQPNTLISDQRKPIVGPDGAVWNPRNYDHESGGVMPLRIALENSINVATANAASLLGLKGIQTLMTDLGLPPDADNINKFPSILGAQPTSLADMAKVFATIANLGLMPREIYFVEGIEKDNRPVWTRKRSGLRLINSVDRTSFYLVRSMMAGVITDGTAKDAMKDEFGGLVAAKTGTSEEANDAWFIAITNDYTVATWVGYDNGKKEGRRTLGDKATGAMAALPIAQRILRYLNYNPQNPKVPNFKPLSAAPLMWDPVLKKYIDAVGESYVDRASGQFTDQGFKEVFRLKDPHGCAVDRAAGGDDRCEVVDKWRALLLPGDLQQVKTPTGDGDTAMDSAQPLNQPTEIRQQDEYQHYQPDAPEPTVPRSGYDRNFDGAQRLFQGAGF